MNVGGRASLEQRPGVEEFLWMTFLQTLRIFKTKTEDGVTEAFLPVLCAGSPGLTWRTIPRAFQLRPALFRLGDVPVACLFMRNICFQEVVVKNIDSRARTGQVSYPL